MTSRLPWHRTEAGFRAYPDGEAHPDRVASITKDDRGLYQWAWTVRYGRARREGRADTAQEAADEVTRLWPAMAGEDAAIVTADIEAASGKIGRHARKVQPRTNREQAARYCGGHLRQPRPIA